MYNSFDKSITSFPFFNKINYIESCEKYNFVQHKSVETL